MIRKIVQIEEDRCTGCGLCAHACHESAIAMVDGKAKLIRDDYCDGFGDCLPVCPADAISFVQPSNIWEISQKLRQKIDNWCGAFYNSYK